MTISRDQQAPDRLLTVAGAFNLVMQRAAGKLPTEPGVTVAKRRLA